MATNNDHPMVTLGRAIDAAPLDDQERARLRLAYIDALDEHLRLQHVAERDARAADLVRRLGVPCLAS